ncbi:hypothetical protein HYH02_003712 [Chlamydomonas schloesseri]|uniref:ApaG domain-containing protein n=1 Tax=Chlamydomonas schloesseri TaxID=2026947 RepID=A0A835WRC5_9CHLO|nr:hypothetical protein HYH02_003712 [Chlamydomonas schloesseri]|eukprot:KAG2451938.1 hypothetical protein HYH02_003712 [Chlamydomonas schloesseri]
MAATPMRSALNLHRPAASFSGRPLRPQPACQLAGNSARWPCARAGNTPAGRVRASEPDAAIEPSSSSSSSRSPAALGLAEIVSKRKDLELELKLAVKGENYGEAARLKAALAALDAEDPVAQAKAALEAAIREERYEDAARHQAHIKALEAELGPAALECGLLSTTSTAVTHGVRVQVQSFFLPTKSSPSQGRYMFAYHITITNDNTASGAIVQLRNRHWVIMDGRGKTEEVRGPGVVGEQPILLPGKSYEYTSGCALTTPQGSMEGEYGMVVLDPKDGTWAETMEVKIGKFMLDAKGPQAV